MSQASTQELAQIPKTATMELLPFHDGFHAGLDLLDRSTWVEITSTNSSAVDGNNTTFDRAEEAINRGYKNVIAHIAARSVMSAKHLEELSDRSREMGLKHWFVVGGDAEWSNPEAVNTNAYNDGLSLLRGIGEVGLQLESIGVPGYPAGHYNDEVNKVLGSDITQKLDLLSEITDQSYIQTAFDFDPSTVVSWIKHIRSIGVAEPIKIGLFGPVSPKTAVSSMRLNGGPKKAAEFMARTGLNPATLALGRHARQSAEVAQAVMHASSEDLCLGVSGFTINTIGDVKAALTNAKFAPVYKAAEALEA